MAGKRIVALGLFALVALALGLFASSGTEAGTYKPTNLYSYGTNTAGVASDNTVDVSIPSPDYNYEDSSMYNFGPIAGTPQQAGMFPIGAWMGDLSSTTTLGLLNSACNQIVGPSFDLYNATLNTSVPLTPLESAWTNTSRMVPFRYKCSNNTDDDADTLINDGCPASGAPEATCNEAACVDADGFANALPPYWDLPTCDNDNDGFINDGCPKLAKDDDTTDAAETTAGRRVNDGCPAVGGTSEKGNWCGTGSGDSVDQDGDTTPDDGCGSNPVVGPISEAGDHCANDVDDDGDTTVNDGCDKVGTIAESGPQCIDPEVSSDINLPDYLEYYPHFLNLMLDPDGASGPLLPLVPRARFAGQGIVSTSTMLIEVVILSPGQIAQLPSIKAQMVPGLGYAILTLLNNPIDQQEQPGAVSDFCTSLQSITKLYGTTKAGGAYGVAGGLVSQTNPAANTGILATNTHLNRTYSQSERDFDGDGWENDMDPCFYIPNPGWDPRNYGTCATGGTKAGDTDCDGLPDVCDPAPAVNNPDQDGDGYNNQQDICPLVADGLALGAQNQLDSDGLIENDDLGPKPDSIGNACDDSDNDGKEDGSAVAPGTAGSGNCRDGIDNADGDGLPDMLDPQCLNWTDKGEIAAGGRTQAQISGTNPGTGLYYHAMPWAPVCVGAGLDADGDTYCDATECVGTYPGACTSGLVSDPAVQASVPESYVIDASISAQQCDNAGDEDGDTRVNDGCPVKAITPEDDSCADALDENTQSPNHEGDAAADLVNDGCPAKGAPEALCGNAIDDDGDTNVNDGCPAVNNPEKPDCVDTIDNDGDTYVNDGCPLKGTTAEADKAGAVPAGNAPQSCSDGIDNDLDTSIDAADTGCTCPTTTDPDCDGVLTAGPPNDNCSTTWNPEQTNIEALLLAGGAKLKVTPNTPLPTDTIGDVCDPDDDNDSWTDVVELYVGTDPLDNCPNGAALPRSDAWPLDIDLNLMVSMVDVNKFAGKLGRHPAGDSTVAAPASYAFARLDFDQNNILSMVDVNKYAGWLGIACK